MALKASLPGAEHKRVYGKRSAKLASCVLGLVTWHGSSSFIWQTGGDPVQLETKKHSMRSYTFSNMEKISPCEHKTTFQLNPLRDNVTHMLHHC